MTRYPLAWLRLLSGIIFLAFCLAASATGTVSDVEKILTEIRQDHPLPRTDYLKKSRPLNVDSAYYTGRYNSIEIAVENHPNSDKVASILLKIPGGDQTRILLPAVSRAIGKPHASDRKNAQYSWTWKHYRTGSLHYDASAQQTIVSLFYQ